MEYLAGEPVVTKGSDGVLTQLPSESPILIQHGKTLYKNHCAVCHGEALEGQSGWESTGGNGLLPAPPHDASGHTWHHSDDQLFEVVKYGAGVAMGDPEYRSGMIGFANILTDENIKAILVFIRSTWTEELKLWQQGANDAQTGKEWWRAKSD